MKTRKTNRLLLCLTAASGLVFICLLGIRLDLFRLKTIQLPVSAEKRAGNETWMNILQRDKKIGYSHRRLEPKSSGGYSLADTTYMRINTMGMIQDLHIRTGADLNPDLSLAGFEFTLRSNLFDFKALGEIRDGTLFIEVGDQHTQVPVEDGLYLTGGILDAVAGSDLKTGESRTFTVFDPATLGQRPVMVTVIGDEDLHVMGKSQKTTKLAIDFMGASQTAWIGKDGNVVQESGLMGITLKKVTQDDAFKGLTLSPTQDLTRAVSIASNVNITHPETLSYMRLAVSGIDNSLFLDGGRQALAQGVLTINKEPIPDPAHISSGKDWDTGGFLTATPFVESDHPDIVNLVSDIVSPDDTPLAKVKKITAWIYDNIEKRPVLSVPTAIQTLKNRMGDCNEHAVLLTAMARAAGIPAQIEAGLVYMKGRFYYHAWNALYLDRWITVDALMNQIPADVTHIRFVRGEPGQLIDLMGVVGSVKLKILQKS